MKSPNDLSEKELAIENLKLRRLLNPPLPKEPRNIIKLIKLHISAEEPIPLELHNMVNEACDAWTDTRPTKAYKDDAVYDLVYDIKLWSLLNEREGSKRPLEDAFKSAKVIHDKKNARDIYKASSKNHTARKNLVEKAKADATELYNNQNWDYTNEDIL